VIKISSMPSFGGEVKQEDRRRKILQHVKITCQYKQNYFTWPNSLLPLPVPPACYPMTLV
jgi:hypothetical protein